LSCIPILPAMSSRQRMTIFTSSAHSPASSKPVSPVHKPPVTYRVEERTRTIYVQSSQPPSQWNPQDVRSLFDKHNVIAEPIARLNSNRQTDYIVTQDNSPVAGRKPLSAPAILTPHSRRSNPPSPNRIFKGVRPRILFYHKHDPHYGFTNFSPHSVTYNGKVYPTSEHLFQSFKVRLRFLSWCSYPPTII
jgi:diaminohydroxyphosphoribosylaminopyrimidine deaminase/5-amino-6-(5-phosphoribosylamino)uracil reductase